MSEVGKSEGMKIWINWLQNEINRVGATKSLKHEKKKFQGPKDNYQNVRCLARSDRLVRNACPGLLVRIYCHGLDCQSIYHQTLTGRA